MTEAVPRDINDEGPSLIGSPQMSVLRAYGHVAAAHPFVSDEESDILGAAIYEGSLSAERLADTEHPLLVDEYFNYEKSIEAGFAGSPGYGEPSSGFSCEHLAQICIQPGAQI